MTSALQLLICTYGRTYREAQTYSSYVFTVVSFVPMIVLFSGLKDALWQLAVPVLGQQMVLARVMRGDALVPATISCLPRSPRPSPRRALQRYRTSWAGSASSSAAEKARRRARRAAR
jgi:hypothetical protein